MVPMIAVTLLATLGGGDDSAGIQQAKTSSRSLIQEAFTDRIDLLPNGGKADGSTKETKAAIAKGLRWLQQQQQPNGQWKMEGPYPGGGRANDTAATAFGLLPFLYARVSHKTKNNRYAKTVLAGLVFLVRKQNPSTGDFGGGMYAQALATTAVVQAYRLSEDPRLKRPAQIAVNYLVRAQHNAGGWRYRPKQSGDMSVTGWVVMALVTGRKVGLAVPKATFTKATKFLDSVRNADEGYGYLPLGGSTYTLTAMGLLCRQHLQADDWGPSSQRVIMATKKHLKTHSPNPRLKNMYYYYYATQVMHQLGGKEWDRWNKEMRRMLLGQQERDGSWNPQGEHHGKAGGRLMKTSLALLTLEVHYRDRLFARKGSQTK
ncbi:MAG: hypothetical protein ACFCD0_13280 [Gemmataceae bacterium]